MCIATIHNSDHFLVTPIKIYEWFISPYTLTGFDNAQLPWIINKAVNH